MRDFSSVAAAEHGGTHASTKTLRVTPTLSDSEISAESPSTAEEGEAAVATGAAAPAGVNSQTSARC